PRPPPRADGAMRPAPATGGPARVVEFSADVAFTRPAFTPRHHALAPQGVQPGRGSTQPAVSPGAGQVVFGALGDLWIMATSGSGAPTRLTTDGFSEADPAWAP